MCKVSPFCASSEAHLTAAEFANHADHAKYAFRLLIDHATLADRNTHRITITTSKRCAEQSTASQVHSETVCIPLISS